MLLRLAEPELGFHGVDRYVDRITEAVGSGGRTLLRIAHRSFRYHFLPAESYDRTRVFLPAEGRTWEIERTRNEVRDLAGVWTFAEYWTHDRDCAQRAELAGTGARRTGRDPAIGDVRSIEYSWGSAGERWEQTRAATGSSPARLGHISGWTSSRGVLHLQASSHLSGESHLQKNPASL